MGLKSLDTFGSYTEGEELQGTEFDSYLRNADTTKIINWLLARHQDRVGASLFRLAETDSKDNPFAARILVEYLHFLTIQKTDDREKLAEIKKKYVGLLKQKQPYIYSERSNKHEYYLVLVEWLHELAEILGRGKKKTEISRLPSSEKNKPLF